MKPYNLPVQDKKNEVREMFNGIARNYDFLNHFLSFGIDTGWRKKLIRKAKKYSPSVILDIATGTADLAIMAAQLSPEKIIACDLSTEMLAIGKEKVGKKNLTHLIELQEQDAEQLTFSDKSFDLAMVAFGVRNFEYLEKGLHEILRVLNPGKPLLILEFSVPSNKLFRMVYHFYSFVFLPFIGRMISKDKTAYQYLPASIRKFPCGHEFVNILNQVGFVGSTHKELTFGIVTLYTAFRSED